MSRESVLAITERAENDAAFREQCVVDPAKALSGYDLTAEERAALVLGDRDQLVSLGADERVTKSKYCL